MWACRVDWIRTSDPLHPIQVRYRAAPPPEHLTTYSCIWGCKSSVKNWFSEKCSNDIFKNFLLNQWLVISISNLKIYELRPLIQKAVLQHQPKQKPRPPEKTSVRKVQNHRPVTRHTAHKSERISCHNFWCKRQKADNLKVKAGENQSFVTFHTLIGNIWTPCIK